MDAPAEVRRAVDRLGGWVAGLRWDDVLVPARDRLGMVLVGVVGVTALGAREPGQRRLVEAWRPAPGPAPLHGAGRTGTVDAAAWLNATAPVRLELDDGHRLAGGHPAAHGFPAVTALAAERGVAGPDLLCALVAAYEVAARFGRATRLHPGVHPHGNWGVAGAAAGCARILRLPPDATAAAIDAGSGMPIAGRFDTALDGNPVRDGAGRGEPVRPGRRPARRGGRGPLDRTAAGSLGDLLGTLDAAELDAELGTRWDVEGGYLKQHSACSFTHAAIDAVLAVRGELGDGVEDVLVEIHSLGAGLDRPYWDGPLAAMFSLPFTVATAVRYGRVDPSTLTAEALADPVTAELARRVVVRAAADLDARLPASRACRCCSTRSPSGWARSGCCTGRTRCARGDARHTGDRLPWCGDRHAGLDPLRPGSRPGRDRPTTEGLRVNPHLLQERVATVSGSGLDDSARSRLAAHKATADACRARAQERRSELERVLAGAEGPHSALDLMLELDALERVQDRIDHRLADLCDALSEPRAVRYGDAQPV